MFKGENKRVTQKRKRQPSRLEYFYDSPIEYEAKLSRRSYLEKGIVVRHFEGV